MLQREILSSIRFPLRCSNIKVWLKYTALGVTIIKSKETLLPNGWVPVEISTMAKSGQLVVRVSNKITAHLMSVFTNVIKSNA